MHSRIVLLRSHLRPRIHECLVPKLHGQGVDKVHKAGRRLETGVVLQFAKADNPCQGPHVVRRLQTLLRRNALPSCRRQGGVETEKERGCSTSWLLEKVGQLFLAHARPELNDASKLEQRLGVVGPPAELVRDLATLFGVDQASDENVSNLRNGGRMGAAHRRVHNLHRSQHIESLPSREPREEGRARRVAMVLSREDFDRLSLEVRARPHGARREGDDSHAHEGERAQSFHQFSARHFKTALHLGRHNSLDFSGVGHFFWEKMCVEEDTARTEIRALRESRVTSLAGTLLHASPHRFQIVALSKMADAPPRLRAAVGDLVFVPARVNQVGTDKRSIRLCIDTGIPCIRINSSSSGAPPTGFIPADLVYNAANSMPSSIVEKIATGGPLDSISEELQTLGHPKVQADVMAMASPWVRNLCFTDASRIEDAAAAIMSASSASMRLTLRHPTKSAWTESKRKDAADLLADFGRATELDRRLWENDLMPSKWPGVMIASGLVPQEEMESPF